MKYIQTRICWNCKPLTCATFFRILNAFSAFSCALSFRGSLFRTGGGGRVEPPFWVFVSENLVPQLGQKAPTGGQEAPQVVQVRSAIVCEGVWKTLTISLLFVLNLSALTPYGEYTENIPKYNYSTSRKFSFILKSYQSKVVLSIGTTSASYI